MDKGNALSQGSVWRLAHELSPIAGVKPLLIVMPQLPFFIALFQIPEHAMELRNATLLWIADLLHADQVGRLGFSILGWETN